MEELRFNKETSGKWYVDLPEWKGPKEDLQMVAGADTALDYVAGGNNQVHLRVSENYFENADELRFQRIASGIGNGAYYRLDRYEGAEVGLDMWLCDVTRFVFGGFPRRIFIQKVQQNAGI